ncbi:MAG: VirB4 family type IV secretion system protein [Bdellovibrio sp.]
MNGVLADKLQIWGFEDDLIIFKDGSTGFGLDLSVLDVTTWDSDRINGLASSIDQFLNGLPSHIDVQFVQEIESGNSKYFEGHLELSKGCKNEDVLQLVDGRLSIMAEKDKNGEIPFHRLQLYARRPLRRLLNKKNTTFAKQDTFPEIAEQEFQSEVNETLRLKDTISRSLELIGLEVSPLSQRQILEQVYIQWNPSRKDQIGFGYYDPEYISPSLIFSDSFVTENGFCIGDVFYRVVSLKIMPEVTMASMAQVLRELPFGSKLFLSIHVPDQQKEYESLQTQRRMAFSMARGKRSGVADLESEAKLQDIETLLAELIAQGEKVFDVSLQVLLASKSEMDLELQVGMTLAKMRELSGAEAMQETLASFDIFTELSIPNSKSKERYKKIKTTNLSDFLPLFGPWQGHQSSSILLRSRLGSIVNFDPFSSELTNHNMLISGGSGSGKSFCANILLLHLLKENPKIFIVDIGNSYGRLCEMLGGESVRFGLDMAFSLNPFDLLEGETNPSGEKIKFLVSLIELMTKEDESSGLNKLERAELEESILKCYEKHRSPLLSDLKLILLEHPEPSLRRIGRILNAWTGDTTFGKFIDRPTSVKLQNSLISFDLKGLDTVPDLQAVCLFLITDLVWREVQKDRSVKKILLFDECWQLLENEAGSQFIGNVFRTFRKYYAGVIAISQDIDDFARSKVASAILPNSGTKWILMQKGANQKRLIEVLQLNDSEANLITSLKQDRGKYSEAFLITGDHRSVVAIEPTPLEYWIATTDARDVSYFDQVKKENLHLSTSELVKIISEEIPFGLANQKSNLKEKN